MMFTYNYIDEIYFQNSFPNKAEIIITKEQSFIIEITTLTSLLITLTKYDRRRKKKTLMLLMTSSAVSQVTTQFVA